MVARRRDNWLTEVGGGLAHSHTNANARRDHGHGSLQLFGGDAVANTVCVSGSKENNASRAMPARLLVVRNAVLARRVLGFVGRRLPCFRRQPRICQSVIALAKPML